MSGRATRPLSPPEQVYLKGLLAMRDQYRTQLAHVDSEIKNVRSGKWKKSFDEGLPRGANT